MHEYQPWHGLPVKEHQSRGSVSVANCPAKVKCLDGQPQSLSHCTRAVLTLTISLAVLFEVTLPGCFRTPSAMPRTGPESSRGRPNRLSKPAAAHAAGAIMNLQMNAQNRIALEQVRCSSYARQCAVVAGQSLLMHDSSVDYGHLHSDGSCQPHSARDYLMVAPCPVGAAPQNACGAVLYRGVRCKSCSPYWIQEWRMWPQTGQSTF